MEEELEALRSIYCARDEYNLIQKGDASSVDTIISLKLSSDDKSGDRSGVELDATFSLTPDYPSVAPGVALHSQCMSKRNASRLKGELLTYSHGLLNRPMILDLAMWLQEQAYAFGDQTDSCIPVYSPGRDDSQYATVVVHLDHMRAKNKYTKTIMKWVEDLNLTGRIIFQDWLILIVLQGIHANIKEYLVRQRTVNVDVDSKGRSCKERMSSVLADVPLVNMHHKYPDFKVLEFDCGEKTKAEFCQAHLEALYTEYVHTVQSTTRR